MSLSVFYMALDQRYFDEKTGFFLGGRWFNIYDTSREKMKIIFNITLLFCLTRCGRDGFVTGLLTTSHKKGIMSA
ncbi:hypothetical protein EB241_15785 [Erwinia psidii]|uniref:Uncharacterized protein n=1 Tax=Erwinia psidii TaxID=69224 RepID=A0A3N6UX43_9GAMM|nr:hypothetical protein EB241_15785 [Erwinia psidii]